MRLRQTAGLMEWMVENCADSEAVSRALDAVNSAYAAIQAMPIQQSLPG